MHTHTYIYNYIVFSEGRKKKSEIWKHFVKIEATKGAKCHYCFHTLSFAAGSLSNLFRHLRKKHPKVAAAIIARRKIMSQSHDDVTADGEPLFLKVINFI